METFGVKGQTFYPFNTDHKDPMTRPKRHFDFGVEIKFRVHRDRRTGPNPLTGDPTTSSPGVGGWCHDPLDMVRIRWERDLPLNFRLFYSSKYPGHPNLKRTSFTCCFTTCSNHKIRRTLEPRGQVTPTPNDPEGEKEVEESRKGETTMPGTVRHWTEGRVEGDLVVDLVPEAPTTGVTTLRPRGIRRRTGGRTGVPTPLEPRSPGREVCGRQNLR